MINIFQAYPLHILLVEDRPDQRKTLINYLKEPYCFPEARITEIPTRSGALNAIPSRPFDCAILDLKLPDEIGTPPRASTDLAKRFLDVQNPRDTWIVQWTGWPEDEEIMAFQNAVQGSGVVYEVISKRDQYYPEKIRDFLRRVVTEKMLGRQFDNTYFQELRDKAHSVIVREPGKPGPPVNVGVFVAMLIQYWEKMEPHRRRQALATFRGTPWELDEGDGQAYAVHEKARQAISEYQLEDDEETEDPFAN